MSINIDTSKLPAVYAPISRCKVIDLGSGAAPKFITVELPYGDGGRVLAHWAGIPNLAVDDLCRIAKPPDEQHYVVVGASAGTVGASNNKGLKKYLYENFR